MRRQIKGLLGLIPIQLQLSDLPKDLPHFITERATHPHGIWMHTRIKGQDEIQTGAALVLIARSEYIILSVREIAHACSFFLTCI
jgi:hypothetical protein